MAKRRGTMEPYGLAARDAQDARATSAAIAALIESDEAAITLRLEDRRTGRQVEAPVSAVALRLLKAALAQMAEGHTVAVLPLDVELTTQQAADLMGVSRPYLVKLLEEGQIAFRKVGTHRRVRVEALQRYLAEYQHDAGQALAKLAADSQRLGLYE